MVSLSMRGKLASLEPSLTESELFHFHLQHTCHVRPAFDICAALGQPRGFWWLLDCFVPSLVAAQGRMELVAFVGAWVLSPFVLVLLWPRGALGTSLGRILCLALCSAPSKEQEQLSPARGELIWWFMSNAGGICSPFSLSPLAPFPPGPLACVG